MKVINLNTGEMPDYAMNEDVSPEQFSENKYATEVEMGYAEFLKSGILYTCGLSYCSAICFYSSAGVSMGHMVGRIDFNFVTKNKGKLLQKHGTETITALLALTKPDDRAAEFMNSLEDTFGVAQTATYVPKSKQHKGMMHFYICTDGTAAQFTGAK